MHDITPISVRYTRAERMQLEERAARAGYRHLSAFIRDRSLERTRLRRKEGSERDAWMEHAAQHARLLALEREAITARGLLVSTLLLLDQSLTRGQVNAVRVALHGHRPWEALLGEVLPELAQRIEQEHGDRDAAA